MQGVGVGCRVQGVGCRVQGVGARAKMPSPRTLQQAYAQGHMVVLGWGRFLTSEVPLYKLRSRDGAAGSLTPPVDNNMANGTSPKWTSLRMLPESGSIP